MNRICILLAGLLMISLAPLDTASAEELSPRQAIMANLDVITPAELKTTSLDDTMDLKQPTPTPKPAASSAAQSASSSQRYTTRSVKITYYCPCARCNGNTLRRGAWGAYLREGMVASKDLPRGTRVRIGGRIYVVADRCGRSGVIDIFKDMPHSKVYNLGSYRTTVQILL